MRYLAVVDILVLPICGILTGILAIRGDVFCSNPDLIYITGTFGLGKLNEVFKNFSSF